MLSLNSRLSLATLLLLSSSGFADEAYTIAIHRPDKVGQKYRVQASGDFKRVIENYSGDDRRPPLMIAYRVDIAAESEVLAVGPAGEAVKIRFTIARLNRLVDRRSTPVLEKDATVTAELVDKKVRYAVNDKSADSDVAEALSLVLDGLFDSAMEEKTFAPGAPKKPGDDWPVNSEAAASDLRSAGLAVRPEDIKGKVKLKEIADVEKVRCLVLSADFVAAVAGVPLPPGLQPTTSEMTSLAVITLPVDPAGLMSRRRRSMTMEVKASGRARDNKPAVFNFTETRITEISATPL